MHSSGERRVCSGHGGCLGLYEEPYDPQRPTVWFARPPRQLIGESRTSPSPAGLGESGDRYRVPRNGTRNRSCSASHCGVGAMWRSPSDVGWGTSPTRCGPDEASQGGEDSCGAGQQYPPACSLYETFDPAEARRILKRLEFHYTPKHGSWLNMAEIELSVFSRQCLNRRIPDGATLTRELAALVRRVLHAMKPTPLHRAPAIAIYHLGCTDHLRHL